MSLRSSRLIQAVPFKIKDLTGLSFDPNAALIWSGIVGSGNSDGLAGDTAGVIDATSASWSSGNLRVILVAVPGADYNNTAALRTQSHAMGQFLEGSVSWSLYAETPASQTGTHALFLRQAQFHLQGQLGAPVTLLLCANGTQPTINTVNGAGSTASFTNAGLYLPYGGGVGYPGGV